MSRDKRALNHALLKDILRRLNRPMVETLFLITDTVVRIQCDRESEFSDFDMFLRSVVKRDRP